jgi:hypothetical protein
LDNCEEISAKATLLRKALKKFKRYTVKEDDLQTELAEKQEKEKKMNILIPS